MSRKNKGMTGAPGLIIFTLIVVMATGVAFVMTMIPFINNIAGIRSQAQFEASQDDKGSALAAFLASDAGKGSYAEILGVQVAEGADASLDDDMEATLNKMKGENDPEGRIAVYYDGAVRKNYNKAGEGYIRADLALPGMRKGEVRVA